MAQAKTAFANCTYGTFIKNGGKDGDRLDNFLDKFFNQEKFLTDHGLVTVWSCEIDTGKGSKSGKFESEQTVSRDAMEELFLECCLSGKRTKSIKFEVTSKYINTWYKIPLTEFKKVTDFGGQGGGGKINRGTLFEKNFYADAVEVLEGKTGNRYKKQIIELNNKIQEEMKAELSGLEGNGAKFSGVLEEGSKNKSRPIAIHEGGIVVAAGKNVTTEIGSTLTDITFQYGKDKKPAYLSLKYGPTLTFFNSGVGGRNGPTLFTKEEIESYKVTTSGGLLFMKMFGMTSDADMEAFCDSFVDYPRKSAIKNHKQEKRNADTSAIQKLLQSGIGYGYWMVHNTKGTTLDCYKITKTYMQEASKIIGPVTVFYGRMNGKGKGINMTCKSKHYNFTFNIRNKQGGTYPTHVMCDYKKLKHPAERPEVGGADYQV